MFLQNNNDAQCTVWSIELRITKHSNFLPNLFHKNAEVNMKCIQRYAYTYVVEIEEGATIDILHLKHILKNTLLFQDINCKKIIHSNCLYPILIIETTSVNPVIYSIVCLFTYLHIWVLLQYELIEHCSKLISTFDFTSIISTTKSNNAIYRNWCLKVYYVNMQYRKTLSCIVHLFNSCTFFWNIIEKLIGRASKKVFNVKNTIVLSLCAAQPQHTYFSIWYSSYFETIMSAWEPIERLTKFTWHVI